MSETRIATLYSCQNSKTTDHKSATLFFAGSKKKGANETRSPKAVCCQSVEDCHQLKLLARDGKNISPMLLILKH
jgi:hypothetical protein